MTEAGFSVISASNRTGPAKFVGTTVGVNHERKTFGAADDVSGLQITTVITVANSNGRTRLDDTNLSLRLAGSCSVIKSLLKALSGKAPSTAAVSACGASARPIRIRAGVGSVPPPPENHGRGQRESQHRETRRLGDG